MSDFKVEVVKPDDVIPHPNADRLEMVVIKGWQVAVGKGEITVDDTVAYFPPETLIPKELADEFNITKYCSLDKVSGMYRIRACRLRSVPSYGFVTKLPGWKGELGKDLAEFYGAKHYQPPEPVYMGWGEPPLPNFPGYTDIQNYNNYPNVFQTGELVYFTEKLHGTNCRLGWLKTSTISKTDSSKVEGFQLVAGSHKVRRKEFDDDGKRSIYWLPMTDTMRAFLMSIPCQDSVEVFGEIYGPGIQNPFHYGLQTAGFRVFDIMVDGKYLDFREKMELLKQAGIEMVPVLYCGDFSDLAVKEFTTGKSSLADHIREGIVITPAVERTHPDIGRVILKSVSPDYLAR